MRSFRRREYLGTEQALAHAVKDAIRLDMGRLAFVIMRQVKSWISCIAEDLHNDGASAHFAAHA